MNNNNLSVVIVGAGNVATHLAPALLQSGCRIVQVYSRTEESALALALRLDCPYTTDLSKVDRETDIYIVSVKDSALEDVTRQLSVHGNSDALYLHTAGTMPMDVWKDKVRRYGVLYPMQTFSKERNVDFSTVPFFIEAISANDILYLKEMTERLGSKVYVASSEQRKCLHIAAVFACNFTNHMYAICKYLLDNNGLPFESMLPLIDETARKVHELSPVNAQTGPACRNDRNVIERHLDMLKDEPELAVLYRLISRSISYYELKRQEYDKL